MKTVVHEVLKCCVKGKLFNVHDVIVSCELLFIGASYFCAVFVFVFRTVVYYTVATNRLALLMTVSYIYMDCRLQYMPCNVCPCNILPLIVDNSETVLLFIKLSKKEQIKNRNKYSQYCVQ